MPSQDASFCAFPYAYPVDHFIRALKYGKALANARVLGESLALQFPKHIAVLDDVVTTGSTVNELVEQHYPALRDLRAEAGRPLPDHRRHPEVDTRSRRSTMSVGRLHP